MIVERLEVKHFRRVRDADLALGAGLNVIHGPNDLGKSTLAEAVRAALLLRSNAKEAERLVHDLHPPGPRHGVHVCADTTPWSAIGRKAVARALSDVAAMAGRPLASIVAAVLPPGTSGEQSAELFDAMRLTAEQYKAPIIFTPNLSSVPSRNSASAVLSAVCPPIVGRTASGRSFSMILATTSGVTGST